MPLLLNHVCGKLICMYKTLLTFIIFTLFISAAQAYELVIIQGLSRTKQSFITRTGKDKKVFVGKEATFTAENISIIAKARSVTREFAQWEIVNDYTDVPFKKGQIVTMYDTKEYIWALNPEIIKTKYIKSKLYKERNSLEASLAFSRGISESVSEVESGSISRSGFHFETLFQSEFNRTYSLAYGIRYSKDVINVTSATLNNTRFLGVIEGRFYFDPIPSFYDAQVSLALGLGYGQSSTKTSGQTSFGQALLLPTTKISLNLPVNKKLDINLGFAFDSLRTEEKLEAGKTQTSNLVNTKFSLGFRHHL